MSRSAQRTTAIQGEANPANGPVEPSAPVAERKKTSLGWRVAVIVWMFGFVAIFGYELWNLVWKVVKRMF
jgi:hypothetical protein